MKQIIPNVTALFLAAAVFGCASSQETPHQQTREEYFQKESADAALRAENVRQNWSKLHEGLTFDDVEQLVGPFNEHTREMAKQTFAQADILNGWGTTNTPVSVSSRYTVLGENYILTFEAGKLKSWTLK